MSLCIRLCLLTDDVTHKRAAAAAALSSEHLAQARGTRDTHTLTRQARRVPGLSAAVSLARDVTYGLVPGKETRQRRNEQTG